VPEPPTSAHVLATQTVSCVSVQADTWPSTARHAVQEEQAALSASALNLPPWTYYSSNER
jgi:hypothetical protein